MAQEVEKFEVPGVTRWLLETRLLAEHGVSAKEGSGKPGGGPRAEKMRRPEVGPKMSNEKWSYFMTLWNSYRDACSLVGVKLLFQLNGCMDEFVREDHHNQFSGVEAKTEADRTCWCRLIVY